VVVGCGWQHDDVAQVPGLDANVHLLEGNEVALDEIRIGGVGEIVGNTPKPGRRPEQRSSCTSIAPSRRASRYWCCTEAIVAAGRKKADPERRILKMLSARGSQVAVASGIQHDNRGFTATWIEAGEGIRTLPAQAEMLNHLAPLQ
jgi:hypothetical protein